MFKMAMHDIFAFLHGEEHCDQEKLNDGANDLFNRERTRLHPQQTNQNGWTPFFKNQMGTIRLLQHATLPTLLSHHTVTGK